MRGWQLLGVILLVGGFLYYVDQHLEDFGLGEALKARHHTQSLATSIETAKVSQERQRSELMAMSEIMAEIDHRQIPRPQAAPTPSALGGNMVGVDPRAVERVQSWQISDEMKAQILRNYRKTGYLPTVAAQEQAEFSRAPASVQGPNGSYVEASPEPESSTAR